MSFQTFSSINYGPQKTSYGRSSGDPPFPLRNFTHFFRLFMLQALRLSVVYKRNKCTLGAKPGADNEHTYVPKNVNTLMKMLDFVYFVQTISKY